MVAPSIALAQASDPLQVTFEQNPLFLNADVKPGDTVSRTVTVRNESGETQDIITAVENEFNTGLGDAMNLSISSNGTTYYNDSFTTFLEPGEIPLNSLTDGSERTYTFTASIPTSAGNEYQTTELGFDLVIGFAGGERVTDTDGDNGSGGGGGGSGGGTRFLIRNEAVATSGPTATVSWNTNRPGTSFVVCGLQENGPFSLESRSPFGYEFRTEEKTNLTENHSVVQTDLLPGDYECRPVSRPDTDRNFTVGDPVTFTILAPDPAVAGIATSEPLPAAPSRGAVLGVGTSKGTLGGPTYDEWRAGLDAAKGTTTDLKNDQLSSTTAIASSGERNEGNNQNFLATQITERPFFWGIIALLLGLAAILGTRRFAKR